MKINRLAQASVVTVTVGASFNKLKVVANSTGDRKTTPEPAHGGPVVAAPAHVGAPPGQYTFMMTLDSGERQFGFCRTLIQPDGYQTDAELWQLAQDENRGDARRITCTNTRVPTLAPTSFPTMSPTKAPTHAPTQMCTQMTIGADCADLLEVQRCRAVGDSP